jgi:acetyl esterase/lipase
MGGVMAIIGQAVAVLAVAAAVALLLWASLLYVPLRWRPVGLYLMVFKLYAVVFAPFIALGGAALAVSGVVVGSWWVGVPAAGAAVGGLVATVRVGAVRADLAGAVGGSWEDRIPSDRRARMVSRWWRGRLPSDPEPRLERDVPFATVPGTDRVLVCDVWRPPAGVSPSGLAVVYLHGSAYYILDKDVGTRRLFGHLAAQGHVVVDVAYRLFPETDVPGMVADAKRAAAWVRAQAADLGIDPDRIVLGGGSAGGHLSLLAAYAREDPALTPPELAGSDPPVQAVVSLYGQVHLAAMYDHTGQAKVCHPDDPRPDWNPPPRRGCCGCSATTLVGCGCSSCPSPAGATG